ncbi:MAG TPA: hypothetical protein VFM18_14210, partial [Methanosarcina sp.]|nr:hypothetical protein [Methanosarcina sp.]
MSERLIKRGFYAILIALAVGVMHRQAHSEELMPNPPDSIVVVSQGSGSSRDEAVQHAIIEAANEALGMLVQGDVETDGNAVVKDRITSVTRGVVNKYDVLSDNTDEGQHTVRIRAVVASAPLYETAKSSGVQVYKVDGGRMFAEQVSVRNSVVNGRKLIYEAF